MKKYICKLCGFSTYEEGEADLHAYEDHGGLSTEDCFEEREALSIEVTGEIEEDLDEESAVTQEELEDAEELARIKDIVDNWLDLDKSPETESLKGVFMSYLMGKITSSEKKFEAPIKAELAINKAYEKVFAGLRNESYICPLCKIDLEARAYAEKKKPAKNAVLEKLAHLGKEHEYFLDVIKKQLFPIPKKSDYPSEQRTVTSNPESCSGSKEELAQTIASDPELRVQLFRKWKQELEKKRHN